jgi:hypothetical protein
MEINFTTNTSKKRTSSIANIKTSKLKNDFDGSEYILASDISTVNNTIEQDTTEQDTTEPYVKLICENYELVDINFKKCVSGYHTINTSPINETIWEDINTVILSSLGVGISSKSDGSHSSGMDINSTFGRLSNKSAKYNTGKTHIDISSYRLTTVCSDKNCGTPEAIIEEINKRKNFDYYSIIVRDEKNHSTISYDWFLIPSDYFVLDPATYTWEPSIGKRGKNKDNQTGWTTNEINGCRMSVTFSMSSQLWIHLELTNEIKKFIVSSATVDNTPKYNYIMLHDKLNNI